jgi:hypothetical protein
MVNLWCDIWGPDHLMLRQKVLGSRPAGSLTSNYSEYWVRFEVLTAASMKMSVFWVLAPCSQVVVYRHFSGTCCLHTQGDEGGSNTSETSVNVYQTTRRNNPEHSYLHSEHCMSEVASPSVVQSNVMSKDLLAGHLSLGYHVHYHQSKM